MLKVYLQGLIAGVDSELVFKPAFKKPHCNTGQLSSGINIHIHPKCHKRY